MRASTNETSDEPKRYCVSGLTQVGSGCPFKPAMRLSTAISAILLRVATLALAICGTTRQLSRLSSGSSCAIGSGSVTSRPAARISPARKAAYSAAGSTNATPRRVDEDRAGLHNTELARAYQMMRLVIQRDMQADEIAGSQQFIQADLLPAQRSHLAA